jgi:uncharacterized coiled-coil DUF342 family protein
MSAGLNASTEGTSSDSGERQALAATGISTLEAAVAQSAERAKQAIVLANQELEAKCGSGLSTALLVLCEQRDQALRAATSIEEQLAKQRELLIAEQDRFIAFLMADHERQLADVQKKLATTKGELERRRILTPIVPITNAVSDAQLMQALVSAEQKISSLQQLLETSYAEIDETRKDAARLQSERDEAIRKIEETRLELSRELEWKIDELTRRLDDSRDEAREEAFRMIEELNDARRQLDERGQEIWQLRSRLNEVDAAMNTRPPPPGVSELEAARYEVQLLRKQLIDAKREQSRLLDELEGGRTRRGPLMLVDDQEALTPRLSQIFRR